MGEWFLLIPLTPSATIHLVMCPQPAIPPFPDPAPLLACHRWAMLADQGRIALEVAYGGDVAAFEADAPGYPLLKTAWKGGEDPVTSIEIHIGKMPPLPVVFENMSWRWSEPTPPEATPGWLRPPRPGCAWPPHPAMRKP